MAKRSVLYRKQFELVQDSAHALPLEEGIGRILQMTTMRSDRSYKHGRKRKSSDHTIRLVVLLGIDPKHADQMVRGAITLPKGIGKSRRVVAFCEASQVDGAKAAGAVEAGAEELISKIEGGWADFDVAVAHPSLMGKVGKLGRVLGPQGKMPTPKAGTVTQDILTAVKEFSGGRIEFRNDAGGNVHLPVGRSSFSAADLKENIEAVVRHLLRVKPGSAKGQYIRSIHLSANRTPSVVVEVAA